MAGIFGAWNLDGRPIDRGILTSFASALRHRGPDGENVLIEGSMGIGCCHSDVREMGSDSISRAVVFDGRLDDREEILAALCEHSDISPVASDGALVAAVYERIGLDVATRLSGDFAAAILDIGRRRLVLIRDAIGVKPLYYYNSPALFLFASEIKAILSHPDVRTGPNHEALAVFAQSRMHAQLATEATFFKNIWSVPPAHLAVRDQASLSVRRYWDFDSDSARHVAGHRPSQRPEAFREVFAKAVGRRLRSTRPIAISVSGGLDSSAIFCVSQTLRAQHRTGAPDVLGATSTYSPGSEADETRFIAEIETAWNARILRIPAERPGFSVECAAAIWHGESPLLDVQWNTTHAFEKTLRAIGVRGILSGHWGDQFLVDHAFLVDLLRKGAWGTVWRHAEAQRSSEQRTSIRTLASRLARDLFDFHAPDALRPFARRLDFALPGTAAAERWYTPHLLRRAELVRSDPRGQRTAHQRSLYREARSQYHVLCMEWNDKIAAMHGLERAYPFLDRDLIGFLMGVPGDEQSPNGIPKEMLRESMRGIVPGLVLDRRDKADFTAVVNSGVGLDWPSVISCLHQNAMVAELGLVRPDALRRLRAGPAAIGDAVNNLTAWRILEVFSLELWLQVFFNGGHRNLKEPFYDAGSREVVGQHAASAGQAEKALPCSATDNLR